MGWHIEPGPAAGHWTAEQMGGAFGAATMTAIGLVRHGKFIAGVMYENWNGRCVTAHCAVRGRLTRAFIGAIFDYPFRQLGCELVAVPIASTNTQSIRFAEHLGFVFEASVRDAVPGGDLLIYTLRKKQCRFLEGKYGQAVTASRA